MITATDDSKRFCSEIQLFGLCRLSKCEKKDGRYCTDEDLLWRFNEISNEDDQTYRKGTYRNSPEPDSYGDYDDYHEYVRGHLDD